MTAFRTAPPLLASLIAAGLTLCPSLAEAQSEFESSHAIPGTDMHFRLGGVAQTHAALSWTPIGSKNRFSTATIPTDDTESTFDPHFAITPRWSLLNFDVRQETGVGTARGFVEIDFAGSSTMTPRLRHAFVSLGGFLAGQTWTTFMDIDSVPETVDFEGPDGVTFLRQPLLRASLQVGSLLTLSAAAEQTESQVLDSLDASKAPDGVLRAQLNHHLGHVSLAALAGAVRVTDRATQENYSTHRFGFTLSGVTRFKVEGLEDDLRFQVTAGEGIGHYLTASSAAQQINGGQDAWLDADGTLTPLPIFGLNVAYRHRWTEKLRSTLTYSFNNLMPVETQPAGSYRYSIYTAFNFFYSPVPAIDIGMEHLIGTRYNKDGSVGSAQQSQAALRFSF